MSKIILASKSTARQAMLQRAGIDCTAIASDFDERAVEAALAALPPYEHALQLALGKAQAVSNHHPEAYVIGADQLLVCEGQMLHKAANLDELRDKLKYLRGKTHQLISAVVIVQAGQGVWQHVEAAQLTMRNFSDVFLEQYIEERGQAVLSSVGGYHYEGAGLQLFENIQGDYYTILGMPLLELMKGLRKLGMMK